jgi:glyoxylate reductase
MREALPVARCLVTHPLPGDALDRLRAEHDVEVAPLGEAAAHYDTVEGLLCLLTDRIDAAVLARLPRLRVIANYAVGSDNVDKQAAAERGIPVGVTPDVLTNATADLTLALLLAAARRLPEAARDVQEGRWLTWEPQGWLGLELDGATLLVVGPGRIGRAVAHRAEAFGMNVLFAGRGDALGELLPQADVVSLHAPLTPESRGMIGTDELAAMKPGTILVNTARGGLVDQDALLTATHVTAALDVTDPEPLPADHPLLRRPDTLVLPHIGSATRKARAAMADLAVDNLLAGLRGEPLPHEAA